MKKVLIQVWSDNHGHDETFGTQPNKPHYVYDETVTVDESVGLEKVILDSLKRTLMRGCEKLPIKVLARNKFRQSNVIAEIRVRIANSEYVCRAMGAF